MPVIKRRVFISGKKCVVFSAARTSQDPENFAEPLLQFLT
jgi:hypothetical protein